jgi:hypothetical protein
MTLPNFLIIGAAKCGTTALYNYLNQHPQIYMSPYKEPRFFALEGEKPDFRGPADKPLPLDRHRGLPCALSRGVPRESYRRGVHPVSL